MESQKMCIFKKIIYIYMSMDNSNKVKIGIDILFFIVIHFF